MLLDFLTFELCGVQELNPQRTFDCGQCFRWNADAEGKYRGVASGKAAVVWAEAGRTYIECAAGDIYFWRDYLDMETDYAEARRSIEVCDYLRDCAAYGEGIRILRQDKWEALCSFIISQCNNIPRIKGIVEKLCSLYGEPVEAPWGEARAFPTAERVADLSEEALAPLRSGYRAPYILAAARAVAGGDIDLDATALLPCGEARAELKKLNGVGDKVANCVVLFGLHQLDAFPVDVWIKRALAANMPKGFDPSSLGKYAGLAQQYMFFHARETADQV
ncbi:MAG TPA: DNA glycosylase [Candidatus Scatomorpha merdavium]|nr:DNA glycosylase [Candidatus Scatomorpha merdavium]